MTAGVLSILYSVRFPREVKEMLGISGLGCWLAYVFCILSAILCIIYGVVMWNRGDEEADEGEIAKWAKEQREIEGRF